MLQKLILVTGASGQLGSELKDLYPDFHGYNFLFTSRDDLEIGDKKALRNIFDSRKIDYCINCAAYTAVDKAETEQEEAFLVNAKAVGNLAALCRQHGTTFFHISTDYVYDGTGNDLPLKETDPTGPLNVYGESKLKGEELAFAENADSIILRTSWLYSSHGSNFVSTMLRLFSEKDEINVVNDQIGSPTNAADLAEVVMQFIQQIEKGKRFSGIYNYSNSGEISWYEFALAIKELTNSHCKINPVTSDSFKAPAPRPAYSVLDTSKIRRDLQILIPEWKDSLRKSLAVIELDSK